MAGYVSSFLFVFCIFFVASSLASNVCLYSAASTKVLTPLQLTNADCPSNTSYCMNTIYNYGNYQYNGPAALKPNLGEILMFLTQDQVGNLDFVTFLNAKVDTTLQVWVQITGATPTPILLKDDPTQDQWAWNMATNTGNFTWITKPTYTDGVVIGHIQFIDNYCVRASYTQPNAALSTISVVVGTVANPQRIISVPYQSGQTFEFCQYPKTASTHTDATCPGSADGTGSVSILFGPSSVQYTWYNTANNTIVAHTASVSGLRAGNYGINVTDPSTGCEATRYITINEPTLFASTVATTQFTCASGGSASATPNGGAGGFSYKWFTSSNQILHGTGSSISGLAVGSYYLLTSDSCGSTANTPFTITSIGCCGDGTCQANEVCGSAGFCAKDCGTCCPPGTAMTAAQTCNVCPPGSWSNTYQATACSTCPANTYNAGGNATCAPCPANTYSASGSGKCLRCPVGQVRATTDSSCSTCGAGNSASDSCGTSQCTGCAAGTYSADGAFTCQQCVPGTFSSASASSCSTCGSNTYSGIGASSCSGCPSGTTSPAGSTHYLSCN